MSAKIVSLNIYNLHPVANRFLGPIGLGIYHTGIVIEGVEYSFGSGIKGESTGGIFGIVPGTYNEHLKKTILIGETNLTDYDIDCIIGSFRFRFVEEEYNLILNNCNNFTKTFAKELCNYKQPKWINRIASIVKKFYCCGPKKSKMGYEQCYDSFSDYDSMVIDAYTHSAKMH